MLVQFFKTCVWGALHSDFQDTVLSYSLIRSRYWIDFNKWEVFVNDDQTRTFLSLEVVTGGLAEVSVLDCLLFFTAMVFPYMLSILLLFDHSLLDMRTIKKEVVQFFILDCTF